MDYVGKKRKDLGELDQLAIQMPSYKDNHAIWYPFSFWKGAAKAIIFPQALSLMPLEPDNFTVDSCLSSVFRPCSAHMIISMPL